MNLILIKIDPDAYHIILKAFGTFAVLWVASFLIRSVWGEEALEAKKRRRVEGTTWGKTE